MKNRFGVFLIVVFMVSSGLLYAQQPNILFILADDMSYPYASVYGDPVVKTPNLERLAQHGVTFTNAFSANPSCTPSRAAVLTGRYPHKLGEAVNLVGRLDASIPTYVQLLRKEGYEVAYDRKGWAPGDFTKMGYSENPAGKQVEFQKMISQLPKEKPFFFWFGTNDPHRTFPFGKGRASGIDLNKIKVPAFLPDVPEVRGDLADYFYLIKRLDDEVGELLNILEQSGRLENTIIVMTSDNGMPFPHAKANLYDYGTRVPLIISSFSKKVLQNKKNDSFVNLIDLTPTFLDVVGVLAKPEMDGKSLMPVLTGKTTIHRTEVFLERERHCMARNEFDKGAGYPMRAIRTNNFLYIINLRPHRMPGGDEFMPGTTSEYGDVDGGPTKAFILDNRDNPNVKPFFELGFAKRPGEELYDLRKDPYNVNNVAELSEYASVKKELSEQLLKWMQDEKDPRVNGGGDEIDRYKPTTLAWITKWSIEFVKD
ncbi:MAG: sulfatase [Cyclobacteriaceae bacterium]